MKIKLKHTALFLVAVGCLISCKNESKNMTKAEHPGLNLNYMDTTTSPNQNFYNYVNGSWMKTATIPEDRTSWGSFQQLRKRTNDSVLALVHNDIKNDSFPGNSDQAKALMLFKSKLDTTARDKTGLGPIKPALAKIENIKSLQDLQETLSNNPVEIANPFFSIYANTLPKNSKMNGGYLSPGGLGLPNRGYYTKTDSTSKAIRRQYVDHVARMFQFLGDSKATATKNANKVLTLETKLAKPRLTKEQRRDPLKLNNPRSVAEISKMTPAIDWQKWFENLPVKKEIDTLIVTEPSYMKALQKIMTSEDIASLKNLLRWQTFNDAAGKLDMKTEKANWDFYSKTLNGAKKQRPLDKRALSTVNRSIGKALGKIYVAKYFPPKAKKQAETMIHNIIATYKDRISNLEWMTDSTKQKAIDKLEALSVKIGYPDKWKDYSAMEINKNNTYYENLLAASQWHLKDNLSKINEPVDPDEWFMNPQTVNAYNSPQRLQIVFPAAILQPPFYNYKADAAVNYGGMGAVIGHEISHTFDDNGAKYDANGNLNNWWTAQDSVKFAKRTKNLADFYSKIQVKDSLYLNGEYTLGENTADLGGVLSAYNAMQRYYKTHERPGKIDGYTQNQRFFLSWATVWRTKTRPEALRSQIKNDPHSPGYYRAYVPLQNVDAFYKAFNIKEGDSMYVAPEDRVKIW